MAEPWAGMPERQQIGETPKEPEPEVSPRDGLLAARNYLERFDGADAEELVRLVNFAPAVLEKVNAALEET